MEEGLRTMDAWKMESMMWQFNQAVFLGDVQSAILISAMNASRNILKLQMTLISYLDKRNTCLINVSYITFQSLLLRNMAFHVAWTNVWRIALELTSIQNDTMSVALARFYSVSIASLRIHRNILIISLFMNMTSSSSSNRIWIGNVTLELLTAKRKSFKRTLVQKDLIDVMFVTMIAAQNATWS